MEKASELLSDLANYGSTLSAGAAGTTRTEDRARYRDHLAAAALLFVSLYSGDVEATKRLIADERRSFGWDFLAGNGGQRAEAAL